MNMLPDPAYWENDREIIQDDEQDDTDQEEDDRFSESE